MNLTYEKFIEVEDGIKDDLYKAAVSSLMYVMVGTRIDLTYMVSILSQYISKIGPIH